jgi:hypothetical protein
MFSQRGPKQLNLERLALSSEARSAYIRKNLQQPFAKYLHSRTGKVLVPSATGDFFDTRTFAPGDDIRHIDWRASAKSPNLLVRRFRDEEARPLSVFVDVSYLTNSLKEWHKRIRQSDAGTNEHPDDPPGIADLLTLCDLARTENLSVDVHLFGRSHLVDFRNVVKACPEDPRRAQFDARAFLIELEPWLESGEGILREEQRLFHRKAFPGVNVFGHGDFTIPEGRICLFAVGPGNRESSLELADALREKGNMVAALKPLESESFR